MAAAIINQYGKISISDTVIARIAGLTATQCMGVVGLAAAEGLTDLLRKDSVDRGVRVRSDGETVDVTLSIIVKYGVSIAAVAENIIETVTYKLENLTGLTVQGVEIIVRGIQV